MMRSQLEAHAHPICEVVVAGAGDDDRVAGESSSSMMYRGHRGRIPVAAAAETPRGAPERPPRNGRQRDSARWSCAFVIFERPLTLRRFASS